MSSHREAPEISKDPVADNADVYAFVSPDSPSTVTMISNFVPLQAPPGGPNFFEFGDDVLYSIYIDNNGDAKPDIEYQFQFETTLRNPKTFLYNTGPIGSLDDPNWNKRQFYTVTRVDYSHGKKGKSKVLGSGLACPPCNIGPALDAELRRARRSRRALARRERNGLRRAAERRLLRRPRRGLRPRRPAAVPEPPPHPDAGGSGRRRHEDAQHPLDRRSRCRSRASRRTARCRATSMSATSVLGIWGAASRRKVRIDGRGERREARGRPVGAGLAPRQPALQRGDRPARGEGRVERDAAVGRHRRSRSTSSSPELAGLLPVLYPGVFPNLAKLTAARADLVAILLTGHSDRRRPGLPELHRRRRRRTCCG